MIKKNIQKTVQTNAPRSITPRKPTNRVRIEAVAEAAGVSIMSVSRAMRGVEGISAKKREEILLIARRMGYFPNRVAISLAASSSNLIGVSVPTLFGTVFSEIYDSMRATFDRARFATMIDISDYSQKHEEDWVERMIAWRPAGLILTGVNHSARTRERLSSANIPVLEIWDYTEYPIDLCVGIDHFKSGVLMGEHLVKLGYKRPAYIGVEIGKDTRADRRLDGLTKIFMEHGIDFTAFDRQSTTATFDTGSLGTARLLNGQDKAPDVLCYLNDNMAFGGLMYCESLGLNVPEDIGIVGYNGLNINTVLPKRITTTITSRTKMGEVGAKLLVAKILGAKTKQAIEIPVKVDKGQTTMAQLDI